MTFRLLQNQYKPLITVNFLPVPVLWYYLYLRAIFTVGDLNRLRKLDGLSQKICEESYMYSELSCMGAYQFLGEET